MYFIRRVVGGRISRSGRKKRKCWMGPQASGQLALSPLPCTQKGQQIASFAKYSNNPKQQWLPHWRAWPILICHGKRAGNKCSKSLCWVKPYSASKLNALHVTMFSTAHNKLILFICPEWYWQSRINQYSIRWIPQSTCCGISTASSDEGKRYLLYTVFILYCHYCSCSRAILAAVKLVNQLWPNIAVWS